MTPIRSAARIFLERARDKATEEEALYRDLPGYESEHLLAARIVTLIEADLREVERVIAKRTQTAPMPPSVLAFPARGDNFASVGSVRPFPGCDGDAQHEPSDTLNQQDGAA